MRIRLALALVVGLSQPAWAQDKAQTLADLKIELGQLMAEFTMLKRELVTSGAAQTGAAGGDALQRLDAIEAAIARLTSQAEAVEIKVNKVVSDGTNRIGDMEYRLCEVTEGCDVATLPETPVLGGEPASGFTTTDPNAIIVGGDGAPAADGPELAIGEKRDFEKADAMLIAGDFQAAADRFATFLQSFPGSPLTQEVQYKRGEALSGVNDTKGAARSYLDAFSGKPDGEYAPESLLKLGQALGALGQVPEACQTLAEVGIRFAGSGQALDAQTAMQGLGCQ
jgi:tol-pal system protein YbgF